MKRIVVFILLTLLNVAWLIPAEAQSKAVARYGHQSRKAAEKAAAKQRKQYAKAARKQQKRLKKYEKKQRSEVKQAARNATKNVSHPYHPLGGSR